MDITITHTQERPLLKRKEFTVRIAFTGATPSREQLIDAIAQRAGCARNMLIIEDVDTAFGDTVATARCLCYTDATARDKLTRAWLRKRHEKPAPQEEA